MTWYDRHYPYLCIIWSSHVWPAVTVELLYHTICHRVCRKMECPVDVSAWVGFSLGLDLWQIMMKKVTRCVRCLPWYLHCTALQHQSLASTCQPSSCCSPPAWWSSQSLQPSVLPPAARRTEYSSDGEELEWNLVSMVDRVMFGNFVVISFVSYDQANICLIHFYKRYSS